MPAPDNVFRNELFCEKFLYEKILIVNAYALNDMSVIQVQTAMVHVRYVLVMVILHTIF